MKQFNWLTEHFEPKEVIVYSNSEQSHEQFDNAHLERMGYKRADTIKYSVKKGKTTLFGNPFMHEGI